jgi:homoserine dehydrogenase
MKQINIALFGCGVVGSGVYRIIEEQKKSIARQTGHLLSIGHVCVLNPEKKRAVRIPAEILTVDGDAVLNDPAVDIVIEVIGGEREALGIITRALVAGKRVVTANKVVVSKYLPLLRRLEDLHGGRLFYGASVCGSIPILKIIDETLAADRIESLRGVVNGSTNYILSRLAEGAAWDAALGQAREGGFLEADPSADLSGADAAQKLSILAFHAFGQHIPPAQIPTTGIEAVTADDIDRARRQGCAIKLIAGAVRQGEKLILSVAPKLVPLDEPLAWVSNETNLIEVECSGVGLQQFIGKGAGSLPTANAIVSDLYDILASRRYQRVPAGRGGADLHEVERRPLSISSANRVPV